MDYVYLFKTLKVFSDSFISWVKLFYSGAAVVQKVGDLDLVFQLQRYVELDRAVLFLVSCIPFLFSLVEQTKTWGGRTKDK